MKNFLCLILCLVTSHLALAQAVQPDIIYLKDERVIEAKVEEISAEKVAYRKMTSLKGALFSVPTQDIVRIEYPNGAVDEFDRPVVSSAIRRTQTASAADDPLSLGGDDFDESMSDEDVYTLAIDRVADTELYCKPQYYGKRGAVELPAMGVTGLDYARLPMDKLLKDEDRPVEQYAGVYEWEEKNFSGSHARVAWKIDYDNVALNPKKWSGYSWRSHPKAEKSVKLKGNELFAGNDKVGEFVVFEVDNKLVRGMLVESKGGRSLFLWKVD